MHYTNATRMAIAFASGLLACVGHAQQEEPAVEYGRTVGFEYTLTLEDGSIAQSNIGAEPLMYVHGAEQILPALEAQLEGLHINDQKTITVAAEDAYGEINPEAFQEVPADEVPEVARQVGAQLGAAGYDGPIRVVEVKEDTVVLDFNHPLAGQDLKFDIRVVSIK